METNSKNPFINLVNDQSFAIIPELALECGDVLYKVPVAYKTWGTLNEQGTNCMVICHALTGSSDVYDWWGPLLGSGRAFDFSRFYIVCINALGSPYGTASPVTINPSTGNVYGPEFPLTTVKDDANLQRMVLDELGVKQVAVVIGGSMGGMLALEYTFFGKEYVKTAIIIASCACHSAWGISWGEAQRQSIYSDPKYADGYYPANDPPKIGLAAARMSALLTYRSRNSFDSKFGRAAPSAGKQKGVDAPDSSTADEAKDRWNVHNHGNRNTQAAYRPKPAQHYFTAQSYLRYQGEKFVSRFDANCYIAITRKLDTHDVSRNRADSIEEALLFVQQPVLVVGVSSDGLFTFSEQERLAEGIKNATLHEILSHEGHDAFLLEFTQINQVSLNFMKKELPEIMSGFERAAVGQTGNSLFGEAESVTSW